MNKSILLSLSPYWYYLICEGIKKIEVRKTIPQAPDWNRQVECYMTKDKKSFARIPKAFQEKYRAHMGKVGMRFVCCECIPLPVNNKRDWTLYCEEQTCLSYNGIQSYTHGKQAVCSYLTLKFTTSRKIWESSASRVCSRQKIVKSFVNMLYAEVLAVKMVLWRVTTILPVRRRVGVMRRQRNENYTHNRVGIDTGQISHFEADG